MYNFNYLPSFYAIWQIIFLLVFVGTYGKIKFTLMDYDRQALLSIADYVPVQVRDPSAGIKNLLLEHSSVMDYFGRVNNRFFFFVHFKSSNVT